MKFPFFRYSDEKNYNQDDGILYFVFLPFFYSQSCCCNLGQDLLQLFISEVGTDVIFLVNGGKVKAHK